MFFYDIDINVSCIRLVKYNDLRLKGERILSRTFTLICLLSSSKRFHQLSNSVNNL